MIRVRNTLVLVELFEKPEQQIGKIVVPGGNDQYTEAEVIDVGPGSLSAAGGRTETFDLKIGQRVHVKHKEMGRGPAGPMLVTAGIPIRDGDKLYYAYEQSSIVGIIAEPVNPGFPRLSPSGPVIAQPFTNSDNVCLILQTVIFLEQVP